MLRYPNSRSCLPLQCRGGIKLEGSSRIFFMIIGVPVIPGTDHVKWVHFDTVFRVMAGNSQLSVACLGPKEQMTLTLKS